MRKEIQKIIERVIHIPSDFRHKGKSVYTLLFDSGYFDLYKSVTQNDISEVLQIHPHLVNEWLQWSENKRTSDGWYFTKDDNGICFVGHYPEGKEFQEVKSSDKVFACAAFIKKEIENIRTQ